MEEKKEGRRVKITKMLLKESLIELMKEKSIHQISIKEICLGADVNRSTFYRHYDTQYELYDDIITDLTNEITGVFNKSYESNCNTQETLTNILKYIESKRETFLVILSEKSNVSVGEAYSTIISKFIDKEHTTELGAYVIQFVAAGMTSFVWSWLSKEDRRSAKEVASVFYTLMIHGLKRAIDFSAQNGS